MLVTPVLLVVSSKLMLELPVVLLFVVSFSVLVVSAVPVVLVSSLCGQNRMKKIQDKCTYYNVPYIVVEPSVLDDVSYKKMSAIAIVDSGFAKAIIEKMKG